MSMKSLKERAKEFSVVLPFMEGKDKGEMKALIGKTVTIRDYGFLKDGESDYVAFICDEDKKCFYFGGSVLTDQLLALETEGYREEIQKDGLPVLFGEKKSKNKMTYTTVQFYPETK